MRRFSRLVDPFFRADIAHVDHTLECLIELHERAKLGQTGDRPFDGTPYREPLLRLFPRIANCLLQAE
jgi:hypothetical protein